MIRACSSCEWWDAPAIGHTDLGYCHGAPPTAGPDDGLAVWPITEDAHHCGAFRLAERFAGGRDERARR